MEYLTYNRVRLNTMINRAKKEHWLKYNNAKWEHYCMKRILPSYLTKSTLFEKYLSKKEHSVFNSHSNRAYYGQ